MDFKNMNQRDLYINRIKPFINQKLIKVLVGQRRVGKTYILQLLAEHIKQEAPDANFIFIDKEKYEFDFMREHSQLMDYVNEHRTKAMNYLFIDEVQDIEGFERVLRSLHNEPNFDIYCTGSNAKMFSSELATYLSGRQIQFQIGSLNFAEFCLFHQMPENNDTLFQFLKFGGMPYLMHLPIDEKVRFDYLSNVNSTILFRDVVNRHQIRDPRFLSDLMKFLADNTGSLFSANKIAQYLKKQKVNKNVAIILDYLVYLEDAFFINKSTRTDIEGKKQFEVGEKYYFEDIGLRNSIIGFKPADMGKLIENVVYLHLRNCGYSIQIGFSDGREVDFVATRSSEKIFVQVAYLLPDEAVVEREFGNLLKIQDNYPKYVVSFDQFSMTNTYQGIIHFCLLDFLLHFK